MKTLNVDLEDDEHAQRDKGIPGHAGELGELKG